MPSASNLSRSAQAFVPSNPLAGPSRNSFARATDVFSFEEPGRATQPLSRANPFRAAHDFAANAFAFEGPAHPTLNQCLAEYRAAAAAMWRPPTPAESEDDGAPPPPYSERPATPPATPPAAPAPRPNLEEEHNRLLHEYRELEAKELRTQELAESMRVALRKAEDDLASTRATLERTKVSVATAETAVATARISAITTASTHTSKVKAMEEAHKRALADLEAKHQRQLDSARIVANIRCDKAEGRLAEAIADRTDADKKAAATGARMVEATKAAEEKIAALEARLANADKEREDAVAAANSQAMHRELKAYAEKVNGLACMAAQEKEMMDRVERADKYATETYKLSVDATALCVAAVAREDEMEKRLEAANKYAAETYKAYADAIYEVECMRAEGPVTGADPKELDELRREVDAYKNTLPVWARRATDRAFEAKAEKKARIKAEDEVYDTQVALADEKKRREEVEARNALLQGQLKTLQDTFTFADRYDAKRAAEKRPARRAAGPATQ
jgi:hypothetical protein